LLGFIVCGGEGKPVEQIEPNEELKAMEMEVFSIRLKDLLDVVDAMEKAGSQPDKNPE